MPYVSTVSLSPTWAVPLIVGLPVAGLFWAGSAGCVGVTLTKFGHLLSPTVLVAFTR